MDTWQFQIRIAVSEALAAGLRADPACISYPSLRDVLRPHDASLTCQSDAFADYVSEAERLGPQKYPLYEWTRATIGDAAKKAKYQQSFTVHVAGEEVYGAHVADALEAGLKALIADDGIRSVLRFDTNPANNPQPPGRH